MGAQVLHESDSERGWAVEHGLAAVECSGQAGLVTTISKWMLRGALMLVPSRTECMQFYGAVEPIPYFVKGCALIVHALDQTLLLSETNLLECIVHVIGCLCVMFPMQVADRPLVACVLLTL
jgi:hypothetical protein